MLACLVAIPLAAVFGTSLPDMVKSLLDGRWPAESASRSGSLSETPRFEPTAPADGQSAVPPRPLAPDWTGEALQAAGSRAGGLVAPSTSAVIPAGYESPVAPASDSAASGWPAGAVSPCGAVGSRPAAGPSDPAVGRAPSTVDQFTYIQDRLRELGATYYLLESWGSQQQLYRFYCKVAVGGDPTYAHYFEATDSDRLKAMAQVLQRVEAWRAGRR